MDWNKRMVWIVVVLLVAGLLAGCVQEGGEDGENGSGGSGGGGDSGAGTQGQMPELLRFREDPRETAYENFTVTVEPQDACFPAGCPVWTATGNDEDPPVVKFIDLSDLIPEGTHAVVDATATWERTSPEVLLSGMTLQWWGRDSWVPTQSGTAEEGEATRHAVVTHFGPDPAQLILVAIEPERMHEPVEVQVSVRVDYVDQGVHAGHVVGIGMKGDQVPVTVHFADGASDVRMQVRAPDESVVLDVGVEHNVTVDVPVASGQGEHRFVFFGNDEPAWIHVPEENLSSEFLTPVDTTGRPGDWQEPPPQGEVSWSVSLDRTPYWVGLSFDGLDGRSHNMNADVTVTAPDGTAVIEGSIGCQMLCYSYSTFGSGLARPELEPGDYTFTVDIDSAQGWRMAEVVGLYGE